jgi:YHS domain-containing protein
MRVMSVAISAGFLRAMVLERVLIRETPEAAGREGRTPGRTLYFCSQDCKPSVRQQSRAFRAADRAGHHDRLGACRDDGIMWGMHGA